MLILILQVGRCFGQKSLPVGKQILGHIVDHFTDLVHDGDVALLGKLTRDILEVCVAAVIIAVISIVSSSVSGTDSRNRRLHRHQLGSQQTPGK